LEHPNSRTNNFGEETAKVLQFTNGTLDEGSDAEDEEEEEEEVRGK